MSTGYKRSTWITLIFIYLVILGASIVRSTGSGIGCPHWPKCFDQVIPPTSVDQLPKNYKEKYVEGRKKKVEKFAALMHKIGFEKEATALKNDPYLWHEEDFNAARTWTEYGNRLVGFIAGNLVLILFIWTLIKYRKQKLLLLLTFINLILMGFEGWLGSIVVATNLLPWVITLHMFFALIIVGLQFKIIHIAKGADSRNIHNTLFKWIFFLALTFTFIQILTGAELRQMVDLMVKDSAHRSTWIEALGTDFLFHRSFSWAILGINLLLWWLKRRGKLEVPFMNLIIGIILIEFITGILFSYANMPAIIQPIHLLIASLLIGIQFYTINHLKKTVLS